MKSRERLRLPGGFHLPPFGIHQLLALGIVCVALWIAAAFWLGMQAMEQWIGTWQGDIRYHVYLPHEREGDLDRLTESLRGLVGVQGVTVTDQRKAVHWMQRWLGNTGLSDSELADRLPRSIEISPEPDAGETLFHDIRAMAARFGAEVNTSEADLARAHGWLQEVKHWLLYILMIMALAIAIIISNTLRITMIARADEIDLMRLLGAREWFVRMPFVLEGMTVGSGAGMLAWGLVWPLVIASERQLSSAGVHLQIFWLLPFMMVAGGAVGCLGALLATARITAEADDAV